MRLTNKVALISGGARGQGAREARLFAEEGASVVIGDLLEEEGKKVEAQINETGGQAVFVKLDVTSESDWENAVNEAVRRFGKLNVLVNNAAILRTGPEILSIEETTAEEWDKIMAVNAKGVFLGTKFSVPAMREAGGGSIVNISSIAGMVGSDRGSAYGTSKAGVRVFTKFTAIQHAKDGIRANSVHPGPIDTEMIADRLLDPETRASIESIVPMGRVGSVEDVAYGVLFLASDESSYMTGSELVIDGGRTAK